MKHQGTFRLKVDHTCSEPFTTADITPSADSHNAGALQLTLGPEPAGTARYSITEKSPGKYKLTVKECVREIRTNEFAASDTIITTKAAAESIADRFNMITEISLPSTLTKIGERAFALHLLVREALVIPHNTAVIESRAFQSMGAGGSGADGITIDIRSGKLAKPGPDAAPPFPLRDTLIQDASGIAGIILPQRVYDSYTKANLQAIFGSAFTSYRKPDGTAYDFASKP